jgi:hypothetical protein
MNTLSRAITARFFAHHTDYNSLREHWSSLMRSERRNNLTSAHHLLYLVLLGKDWRKAFAPVTNPCKLANGAFYGWALFRAFRHLHSQFYAEDLLAPFDGLVTPEMLVAVRALLPTLKPEDYPQETYAAGNFPLDAYLLPVESTLHA